jgi:sugar O-acyltransferase (sialic acid O-acetyltransferase NeuD family)
MKNDLVLFGDSAFAEIAYEYFTHDSDYRVVAFTVHQQYVTRDTFKGLPVIPFETIESKFSPATCAMHVALTYNKLNRIRMSVYSQAKQKGYTLANYVSSRSFVWENVALGDNVFIFEDNTIQPFVRMGSNNVLWSGNHIGHHSVIGDHNFISSHVVVSGFCTIGDACFIGVNATMANNIQIGKDSFIGAGALITHTIPDGAYVKGPASAVEPRTTYQKFGIEPV